RAVAERDPPEAVDHDRMAVHAAQWPLSVERPIAGGGVGVDAPVAEVPDEQVAARVSESGRSERKAPRRVQLAARCDPPEDVPGGVEHADEAEARPCHLVLRLLVLLRVGDEDAAVEVTDPERGIAVRELR